MNASRLMVSSALIAAALAATPALSQGRPARGGAAVENACPAGAYSVVSAPDGTSVTVLFNDFSAETAEGGASARTRCRIEIPLAAPSGRSIGLTSVDYRGFAMLARRQSAEIDVSYEFGRGNRAAPFHRRLQGVHEAGFAFTDRLPPGQLRRLGCDGATPMLLIDAVLSVNGSGQGAAMIAMDSADQTSGGALRYRFDVRPC